MVLVLLVSIIDIVIDSVLVQPSIDGLRLDTADRQKPSTRPGRDAHRKHTLEQCFTLTSTAIGLEVYFNDLGQVYVDT